MTGIFRMSAFNSRLFLCLAALAIGLCSFAAETGMDVRRTPAVKAIENALPSVVNLSSEKIVERNYSPWGGGDPFSSAFDGMFGEGSGAGRSHSLGSGSIIDPSGLVITNAHVVHNAVKITVTLNDGRSFGAREIASDYLNDLSLLMILDPPSNLKAIETGIPGDILLGETVIAVGNPFGLDSSITQGVVSATGRKLSFEGRTIFSDIVQTDAAVYPGNSGGPLINLEGRMIGINMAFHKEAPGIGFAIPLMRVENILARWLLPERFSGASLGIVPGVKETKGSAPAIFISDIIKGSPAERAGLKQGDAIESFQGRPATDLLGLGRQLARLKDGQEIGIKAGGRDFSIKLSRMELKDGKTIAKDRLSIGIQELTPKLSVALGYPFDGGLIVSDLLEGAPAGVQRGDVLAKLGDTTIHSEADIAKALEGKRYGDHIEAAFISIATIKGASYLTKRLADLTVK